MGYGDQSGITTLPNTSKTENLCVLIGDTPIVVPPNSKVSTFVVNGWSLTNNL